jgi:hypothetical protein
VVNLFRSSVHCAFTKENILSALALWPGMQKKNPAIFSNFKWQLALQLLWKYLTHISVTDALLKFSSFWTLCIKSFGCRNYQNIWHQPLWHLGLSSILWLSERPSFKFIQRKKSNSLKEISFQQILKTHLVHRTSFFHRKTSLLLQSIFLHFTQDLIVFSRKETVLPFGAATVDKQTVMQS